MKTIFIGWKCMKMLYVEPEDIRTYDPGTPDPSQIGVEALATGNLVWSQNSSNSDRFCRFSNLGNSVVLICFDNLRCWSSQNCSCRLLKTILPHANLRISASASAFCSRLIQLGKGHAQMPSTWRGGGIHQHQALVTLFRRTPSLRSGQGQHDLNHLALRLQFGPVTGWEAEALSW